MATETQPGYDRATRCLRTRLLSFAIPDGDDKVWPLLSDNVADAKKEAVEMGETDITIVPDH